MTTTATALPSPRAHGRLSQAERPRVAAELARRYDAGLSIREICKETGYSIGRVRRLLEETGVEFRPRGGANRAGRGSRA